MKKIEYSHFDDFQIIEDDSFDNKEPLLMTELDYIILVLGGARDYNYLLFENKYVLDNEVTTLYPLSFVTIVFIMFMLSFKSPLISYLFQFRKDRQYGVFSDPLFETINSSIYKKWPLPQLNIKRLRRNDDILNRFYHSDSAIKDITYNFGSREFNYLSLPEHFILTPYYNGDMGGESQNAGDKHYKYLFFKRTNWLKRDNGYNPFKSMALSGLEHPFKNDVLFYLPRFYHNYYSVYNDKLIHKDTKVERGRIVAPTDYQKLHLDVDLTDESVKGILLNKKKFYKKLGLEVVNDNTEDIHSFILEERKKTGLIKDVNELHEFFLKSIFIRRPPHIRLNSNTNKTNGFYLFKNGVARFREMMFTELLRDNSLLINNPVRISGKHIFIKYKGNDKILKFKDVYDFNNKPFLLNKRFIKLLDDIYGKNNELHLLTKYAQVYLRLVLNIGDNGIYYLLATELAEHTKFNFPLFIERYRSIRDKSLKQISRDSFSFLGFEHLFYRRGGHHNYVNEIPNNKKFKAIARHFIINKIYTQKKYEYLLEKYLYHP